MLVVHTVHVRNPALVTKAQLPQPQGQGGMHELSIHLQSVLTWKNIP